jgi:hypothetical protein
MPRTVRIIKAEERLTIEIHGTRTIFFELKISNPYGSAGARADVTPGIVICLYGNGVRAKTHAGHD